MLRLSHRNTRQLYGIIHPTAIADLQNSTSR